MRISNQSVQAEFVVHFVEHPKLEPNFGRGHRVVTSLDCGQPSAIVIEIDELDLGVHIRSVQILR
jgi:hypothetical protein